MQQSNAHRRKTNIIFLKKITVTWQLADFLFTHITCIFSYLFPQYINLFLCTSCSCSNFFCAALNCTCLWSRASFSLSCLATSSRLLSWYHSSLFWSFSACFSSKSFNFCWAVSSRAWISSIIPDVSYLEEKDFIKLIQVDIWALTLKVNKINIYYMYLVWWYPRHTDYLHSYFLWLIFPFLLSALFPQALLKPEKMFTS